MSSLTLSNNVPVRGDCAPTNRTNFDAFCDPNLVIVAGAGRQMVGTGRFELPTSRLSVVRSNQLSYAPVAVANFIVFKSERKRFAGRRHAKRAHPMFFLRKEVIQPQVPLRLPCYDFTPVADLTVVGCLL